MNPIFQALVGGHSATQILSFISQAFPKFKPQINKAQKMGYPAEKIVEFLSDTMQSDANSQYETSNKITARKRAENKELTKDILKTGAAAGATAFGYQFLQRIAPGIAKQFMNKGQKPGATPTNVPPSPPSPSPQSSPPIPPPAPPSLAMGVGAQQNQASPIPPNPINPSPAPQIGQQVAQQAQAPVMQAKQTQQAVPQPSPQAVSQPQQPDLGAVLQQSGLKDQIDALRSNNPTEVISKILASQSNNQVKELENALQMPIAKIIEDYVRSAPMAETVKDKISKGVKTPSERSLDISISKAGKLTPITEKTHEAAFKSKSGHQNPIPRKLTDVTYEDKYKNLNPEEKKTFKIIDNAIDKTAKHLVQGKGFAELLPGMEKGMQLSTAEDVLRSLVGMPSKYNLMTPEEQEETFNTFQGISPNVIWNTISLIDPRIQKINRPKSPKGAKNGKEEMTPNDFRRFLAHAVTGMMEKHKDYGSSAKMIVSVVDALDKLTTKKSQSDTFPEFQNLSDEDFAALIASVPEEEVKKFR